MSIDVDEDEGTAHVSLTRRCLLKRALWSAAAVSAMNAELHAAELERISDQDATARGLGYHAEASTVDIGVYPEYDATQNCAGCIQVIGVGQQYGCKLMPDKEVNPQGWCKVWAPQA